MQGLKTGAVVRGLLTIVFLMGMALFSAVPAGATHDCADTSTADSDEGAMHTDTQIACPESAIPGGSGGRLADTAGSGDSPGVVPTRIDAGAGGAAAAGNTMALGAVLTGAASAGAGALAAWRRRH